MQDESDQAMSAYRAGQRLGGSHVPLLYVGMEYLRTNNLTLANHFLNAAVDHNNGDPCAYSELGIVAFRQIDCIRAGYFFFLSISIFVKLKDADDTDNNNIINEFDSYDEEDEDDEGPIRDDFGNVIFDRRTIRRLNDKFWEPTLNNLGHVLRKLRHYDDAIFCFEKALSLDNEPTARSALAFTHHCSGDIDTAIDLYHESLAQHQSAFCSEMLNRALSESVSAVDEGLFSGMDSFFEDVDDNIVSMSSGGGQTPNTNNKSAMSMSLGQRSSMSISLGQNESDGSIFMDAASGDDISMG